MGKKSNDKENKDVISDISKEISVNEHTQNANDEKIETEKNVGSSIIENKLKNDNVEDKNTDIVKNKELENKEAAENIDEGLEKEETEDNKSENTEEDSNNKDTDKEEEDKEIANNKDTDKEEQDKEIKNNKDTNNEDKDIEISSEEDISNTEAISSEEKNNEDTDKDNLKTKKKSDKSNKKNYKKLKDIPPEWVDKDGKVRIPKEEYLQLLKYKEKKKRIRKVIRAIVFTLVVVVTFILCANWLSDNGPRKVGEGNIPNEPTTKPTIIPAENKEENTDYVDPEDVPSQSDEIIDEDADNDTMEPVIDNNVIEDDPYSTSMPNDGETDSSDMSDGSIEPYSTGTVDSGDSKKQDVSKVIINKKENLPEMTLDPKVIN